MAHLATIGAHHVNGVAALHSDLIKRQLLPEFAVLWPEKFTNVTNGVTPRRWVALSNPSLSNLLEEEVGPNWITNMELLKKLEEKVASETLSKVLYPNDGTDEGRRLDLNNNTFL